MTIRDFTDAGRAAIDAQNVYAALSLALSLPDVCGSMAYPGTNGERYIKWYDIWVGPTAKAEHGLKFPDGNECWQFRNEFNHAGRSSGKKRASSRYHRFLLGEPGHGGTGTIAGNVINGKAIADTVVLDSSVLCRCIFTAADLWDEATKGDPIIRVAKEGLFQVLRHGRQYDIGGFLINV